MPYFDEYADDIRLTPIGQGGIWRNAASWIWLGQDLYPWKICHGKVTSWWQSCEMHSVCLPSDPDLPSCDEAFKHIRITAMRAMGLMNQLIYGKLRHVDPRFTKRYGMSSTETSKHPRALCTTRGIGDHSTLNG